MIIGVCSYGNTGSGAVFDLLKEYDELEVVAREGSDFEFKFTYMPDGLEDLEFHLCQSPNRWMSGDYALKRFKNLMEFYGKPYSLISRKTNNQYYTLTKEFFDDIVQVKWTGRRLFKYMHQGEWGIFIYRLRFKVQTVFYKRFHKEVKAFPSEEMYFSYCPDNFLSASKKYIASLITCMKKTNKEKIVLDQPFSGDYPEKSFKYFDDPFAIVVDRDPRDLYITAKYIYPNIDCWIPTQSIDGFITYYRQMRCNSTNVNERILRIRFEDLIYEYELTCDKIQKFLNISSKPNRKYFDPSISIQNTQLYKLYPNEHENIMKIENHLKNWLYPFEKYGEVKEHNTVF